MPICKACLRDLDESLFARNKHAEDGSGLSPWCRQCAKEPAIRLALKRLRGRDWVDRNLPNYLRVLHQEGYEEREAVRADRKTLAALKKAERDEAARTPQRCRACQRVKMKVDFPRVAHDVSGRSLYCTACMLSDPDGAKRLAAERSRARYEMMRETQPAVLRQKRRDQARARYEQKRRALERGVERRAYEQMSPLEQYKAAYGEGSVRDDG